MVDENKNLRVLLFCPGTGARVALDHALRSEEGLDLLAQLRNAVVLLQIPHDEQRSNTEPPIYTYPHPIWPLGAESETLKAETDARLAGALLVRLLVAFLEERG